MSDVALMNGALVNDENYSYYLPSNMESSATNMAGLQTNMDF